MTRTRHPVRVVAYLLPRWRLWWTAEGRDAIRYGLRIRRHLPFHLRRGRS